MFKPYRRPTVAVIGAGPAGCAAAAECAFSGFETSLFDANTQPGGTIVNGASSGGAASGSHQGSAELTKRYHFNVPYLKLTDTDGSVASFVTHLEAALNAAGAKLELGATVTTATFDEERGQWAVASETSNGSERPVEYFDIVVRATGSSASNGVRPPAFKAATGPGIKEDETDHLHLGIHPIGLPNALFVDGPYPANGLDSRLMRKKPLAIAEARGEYCRRYARFLEVNGPGELRVQPDHWLAQQATVKQEIANLTSFEPFPYKVYLLADSEKASSKASSKAPSKTKATAK
ncbi:FAD-dependent oxidoreductase [Corynebacterium falsenii]|uniref:FAD-dependent oxidoreductase n=1 Tax=Corynebacterium falsenii TaxID=108486 RepID=UPI001CCEDF6A|nr:FAD-dependent oxidoreductase [Corynebacterium falsenii]UBI07123.1 FAD-dependent oxidoreductase [Corynebacterium falsenii]